MPVPARPSPDDERDALIEQHHPLVRFLARRLLPTLADHAELDDLIGAGMLGLIAAADTFDATRGHAFSTFATLRIRGAMLDELRRHDHLPRSVRRRLRGLDRARGALSQRLLRRPEPAELAAELGVPVAAVWEWTDADDAGRTLRIDAPCEDVPSDEPPLVERLPDERFDLDVELDRELDRERLFDAIAQLDADQRRVIVLSFFEDLTLREIGDIIRMTESGVSRLRGRAIGSLRALLRADRRSARRKAA